jgi:hypothetical protein
VRKAEAELTSQIGLGLPLKRLARNRSENSNQKPRAKSEDAKTAIQLFVFGRILLQQ